MIRKLWFRLAGGYLVVIAVALALVVLVAGQVTARQFDLYVTQQGQQWATTLVPSLEAYYADNGSWEGVSDWLNNDTSSSSGMMGMGSGQGMMMRWGNMWAMMDTRLLLADSRGQVVADSENEDNGRQLPFDVLAQGMPLEVNGQQAGTLVVAELSISSTTRQFASVISRSVGLAALVAALLALVLGVLLSQRITRPLHRMADAAQQVASGNLDVSVPAHTHDELGQLAQAFNEMASDLRSQRQLRRQMVSDVAHELRTPLSVMQGTLEAMLDGLLPAGRSELEALHQETLQLARLVADLRVLSLADAGQLELELQPVDVAYLVSEVVQRMLPLASEKSIHLEKATGTKLASLQADPQRLTQVLSNLIDNALRYAPQDGMVKVVVTETDNAIEMSVNDNGPGIPPEALPHIFDRFWRGEKSRNRAEGGSGLGLAIARQLTEAHGGTIAVESEAGEGATFRVVLPRNSG